LERNEMDGAEVRRDGRLPDGCGEMDGAEQKLNVDKLFVVDLI